VVVFSALCVHSLAASLLQAPGAAASVGFGGYVGSSRVDTASPFEGEVSLDVDGEAALHLRRLSKKDPITKVSFHLQLLF
jgi:hypothetical protein